ncbi:hypothetical protein K7432_008651 [Basidiobolus ranarum]|uniref:Uncharacterized protein n=1 Tax=Basidiobolus ranarum TaxID=34480 RepID=A0ABR2VY88_9FUNG
MRTTEDLKRNSMVIGSSKSLKKNHRTYKRFSFHPFLKLQKIEKLDCEYSGEETDDVESLDTTSSPLSSPTYSNWLSHDSISPKPKKSTDSSRKLKFFKTAYFQSSSPSPQQTNIPPPLPPRSTPKFLLAPKYHMFSDLSVDFSPFRLVLFKVLGSSIWFRMIDAEEQTRLLYVHERLLESSTEGFLEESLSFEVFEDVEHVCVSDVYLQSSPSREIFQLTSRKSQLLLEALSNHSKRDFINRITYGLEAKLNPIVTDRMVSPDGSGLLEKLFSLQYDGTIAKNRNFVDTIAEVSTRCLKYGGYISRLQDTIQVKAKELDDALAKQENLERREQELQKLMSRWDKIQNDIGTLTEVEESTQRLLLQTENSHERIRKGEVTLSDNQTMLNSIKKSLNRVENTKEPVYSSFILTVVGVLGSIGFIYLLCSRYGPSFMSSLLILSGST